MLLGQAAGGLPVPAAGMRAVADVQVSAQRGDARNRLVHDPRGVAAPPVARCAYVWRRSVPSRGRCKPCLHCWGRILLSFSRACPIPWVLLLLSLSQLSVGLSIRRLILLLVAFPLPSASYRCLPRCRLSIRPKARTLLCVALAARAIQKGLRLPLCARRGLLACCMLPWATGTRLCTLQAVLHHGRCSLCLQWARLRLQVQRRV